MSRCKFVTLAALGLLALIAGKPSQAQWVISGYTYSVVSITPNPSPDPANIGAGYEYTTPSVYAITKTDDGHASVSVSYSKKAHWTGPAGSTPTAGSAKASGEVQGIATAYGNGSPNANSSVGDFLGGSVMGYKNYTPPPYKVTSSQTSQIQAGYTDVSADFILTATANGYEGYATATGTLEFTF